MNQTAMRCVVTEPVTEYPTVQFVCADPGADHWSVDAAYSRSGHWRRDFGADSRVCIENGESGRSTVAEQFKITT